VAPLCNCRENLTRRTGHWVAGLAIGVLLLIGVVYAFALFTYISGEHAYGPAEAEIYDYLEKGQYNEALRKADMLVQRFGADRAVGNWAHYTRALVHVRRNDLGAAIGDLTLAIGSCLISTHVRVKHHVERGRCYEQLGMHRAASEDYAMAYAALLAEYDRHNKKQPEDTINFMEIIEVFWSARQHTDEAFGFDELDFEQNRDKAVLNWLLEFVDVHPKINASIDDVDAKVFSLE